MIENHSSTPRVSIIVVSWNVRDLLLKCLQSVFSDSSAPSLEVIVVDNDSSDDTVDTVVRRFPQVTLIRNHLNVGFPIANNEALSFTSGEYVLYLNPDTEVRPGTLDACVAELDRDPSVGAVGSRLEFPDGTIQFDGARRTYRLRHLMFEVLYLHTLFPHSRTFGDHLMGDWDHRGTRDVEALCGAFIMVRRGLAVELGGLPTEVFMYHEDLSFCLRILKRGYGIRYLGNVTTVHHTKQSSSRSSAPLGLLEAECKYRFVKESGGSATLARVALAVRAVTRLGIALPGALAPRGLKKRYPRVFDYRMHFMQLAWSVRPASVRHLMPRPPANGTTYDLYRNGIPVAGPNSQSSRAAL